MTGTSITSNARTEDQGRQILRKLEDLSKAGAALGLKKVNPDKDGTQSMIESDEVAEEVNQFYVSLYEKYAVANQFADEEEESDYEYPDEYKGAKPIGEQIAAIAEIFGLSPAGTLMYAENLPELPEGAEGWFAVPNVEAVAKKFFPEITDPAEQYCKAVQLVLEKIKDSGRSFYNYREGQITPEQLRLHARTARMLAEIAKMQNDSEILLVPCQLGMRHRGKSVRRARETFMANEFGLGSFIGGCIALTHPERYSDNSELESDMAGDEFSESDGKFDKAPYFYFSDGLGFDTNDVDNANKNYGSASGFVPQ